MAKGEEGKVKGGWNAEERARKLRINAQVKVEGKTKRGEMVKVNRKGEGWM